MTPRGQRRWSWFQQTVDALAAALATVTVTAMLIRDSWPVGGIVFALICLGKVGSTAAVNVLLERWAK